MKYSFKQKFAFYFIFLVLGFFIFAFIINFLNNVKKGITMPIFLTFALFLSLAILMLLMVVTFYISSQKQTFSFFSIFVFYTRIAAVFLLMYSILLPRFVNAEHLLFCIMRYNSFTLFEGISFSSGLLALLFSYFFSYAYRLQKEQEDFI